MSLTPTQKLEFIENSKEQTTELLRKESLLKVEKEQKTRASAETFKQQAKERYLNRPDSNSSMEGVRKFASMKRSSGAPNKPPPRKFYK